MNQEIRERTKWFMDARFGMFIHWGLYSIPACGEWVMSFKEMTVEQYRSYFDQFDPVDYDPKKWVTYGERSRYEICCFNCQTSRWILFV